MHHKGRIVVVAVLLVLALLFGACAVYICDYYRADTAAIGEFLPEGTSFCEEPDGRIVIGPEDAAVGMIFYPGGKVEHRAYIPLMQALAERGILAILVKMPLRLAVLDVNAADGIREEYPAVRDWYIGGHSLGGSMAASYLSSHTDDFRGLLLLGAYSTADLSATDLSVLSVFGSEDRVMNREKYAENQKNLPAGYRELVIEGGCHAGFGMYGAQEGDGTPTVTAAEQITATADAIAALVGTLQK